MAQASAVETRKGVDYIGVTCAFICHDGQQRILLHKRSERCRDEQGRWDNGAGSMEFGEDFEAAVRREVREEYGANILDLRYLGVSNVLRTHGDTPTHWIAVVFAARVDPSEVRIAEPESMDAIGWFTLETLPSPLHSQFQRHIALAHVRGIV